MTVAEQIEARNQRTIFGRMWHAFTALAMVAVPVIAFFVAVNGYKTAGVAHETADVARKNAALTRRIDMLLDQSINALCAARATTLRTAPQTVREIRSVQDTESPIAILVCPNLDYAGLRRQRLEEIKLLKSGVAPSVVANRKPAGQSK